MSLRPLAAVGEDMPKVGAVTPLACTGAPADCAVDWNSDISVQVQNLRSWISDNHDPKALRLYLNGNALEDARLGPELGTGDILVFHLFRTSDTKDVWKTLLGHPCDPSCTMRVFRATVGLAGKVPFDGSAPLTVRVIRLGTPGVILAIIGVIALGFLVFHGASRSYLASIVRETDTNNPPGPFSLGRSQMMYWFLLVVVSYLLIYALTGYYDSLTPSVLALIGISGGTSLLGVVIDSGSRDDARKKLPIAQGQLVSLQSQLAAGPALAPQIADLTKQIADLERVVNPHTSGSFLRDILSYGGNGDSGVHRFQIVIWTLTLGGIFLVELYNTLAMPDFPAALLGLMGISSGTYLGFKVATQS